MDCEEFWKTKIDEELLLHQESSSNDDHLAHCKECRQLVDRMRQGLESVKSDIHREESAEFWSDMRREISREVRTPGGVMNWLQGFRLPAVQWTGILATAMLVIWALVFRISPAPMTFSEEEIAMLVGAPEFATSEYIVSADIDISSADDNTAGSSTDFTDLNLLMIDIAENGI